MHGMARSDKTLGQWRSRRVLVVVLGLAILFVGAYWLRDANGSRADTVITEAVKRGDLEETVTATGKIQPRAYVDVGAQASGQLNRILVRIGDVVKQGQLLAEIDPQVQAAKVDADEAQLAQYNANLVEQQANVVYADATLGRYAKLIASDAASHLTFDESTRDAKTAAAKADAIRAEIKQMQSTLKADQVALGYTKIYAPMTGTVVSIDAKEGQTLNSVYSTPQIMRVADLATMTVWTQVSEADVTRLKDGMPVYFTTLGHGDRRWTATVRQILPAPAKPERAPGQADANAAAPAAANNVVLYTVLFDVDNAAGDLRPEMTAQVFFVAAHVTNAVIAPVAALHAAKGETDKTTVTVLDGSGVRSERPVIVGLRTRFQAEIVAGLEAGESVVTGSKPAGSGPSLVGFRL